MSAYIEIIKKEFPAIDESVREYIEGVLHNAHDEIESCDDIYDAIGDILLEIGAEKSEEGVRTTCEEVFRAMKPKERNEQKMLHAPVNIAEMAADMENNINDIKSIWVVNRDYSNKVDSKKLEKAEAKLQQKLEKRENIKPTSGSIPSGAKLQTATASQVFNKKETKLESKGLNRSMDIRIENFDLSFGEKVLLQNAELLLAYGRRYGLVGRNGLGKSTLLRMISEKQLKIPSHISILHVEQEVVGNDTTALDSVLECDNERTRLLLREKDLLAQMQDGGGGGGVDGGGGGGGGVVVSNTELSDELAKVYADLQNIEADKAVAKASIILRGLGFTADMQKQPTKSFSGGWRMRLALARALFSKPDLLLLDEPTNMLDIKAIIWLENYLQSWPTTLLVVSHDRNFLDTVPTDIIHLHTQRLDTYKGNYEQFYKTKTEKLKAQRREYEAQMAHRSHVQEFIDRFRYNANRASSVQSKIKMLEKLPELKPVEKEIEVKLKFPEVESLNPPVLALNEISFKYENSQPIFLEVSLSATSDSRICIVGENGAGKSTLLKLVIGHLTPTSGIITTHRALRTGYFAQHHVDHLDMNLTCIGLLESEFPGKPTEEYRRQLGSFGISGDLALQQVASLSGGQKSRLAFAKMCMAEPNFIILDEPTNHLDIETIDALGKAVNNFKGGIIVVSHDERLIHMICKELWVCGGGTVKSLDGGIEEYKKQVLKEIEAM